MSLRLLPAFTMDNDEDDDGNFTKWMSSYWGHGAEARQRERKRSFRRPKRTQADRRPSLPTVSQLDAMKLNRLHAAAMAPTPSHIRTREEKMEVRPHQRARRSSSDDNSHKSGFQEKRISTIPELTESFERRLSLSNKSTLSLNDGDKSCLICHEDIRKNEAVGQGLHCMHRLHKEVAHRLEPCRPRSSSEATACSLRRPSEERRMSAEEAVFKEREKVHTLRRQLSLRRHR
ncbi:leukemia NUP98 fusion partner 1 [Gouania willdenowi]|uniref:leukemia NUP98 fusion partner 1 n=1 Tax=Gouania willdenowi TaxID=441366 RepID=UPI0010552E07|nr:leukemia NUP98 fusion partner 1 [Gouania willdenowi]